MFTSMKSLFAGVSCAILAGTESASAAKLEQQQKIATKKLSTKKIQLPSCACKEGTCKSWSLYGGHYCEVEKDQAGKCEGTNGKAAKGAWTSSKVYAACLDPNTVMMSGEKKATGGNGGNDDGEVVMAKATGRVAQVFPTTQMRAK